MRGFFALSHGVSWVCWSGAILLGGTNVWETPGRWLIYLGGVGPLLAVLVAWRSGAGSLGPNRKGGRHAIHP